MQISELQYGHVNNVLTAFNTSNLPIGLCSSFKLEKLQVFSSNDFINKALNVNFNGKTIIVKIDWEKYEMKQAKEDFSLNVKYNNKTVDELTVKFRINYKKKNSSSCSYPLIYEVKEKKRCLLNVETINNSFVETFAGEEYTNRKVCEIKLTACVDENYGIEGSLPVLINDIKVSQLFSIRTSATQIEPGETVVCDLVLNGTIDDSEQVNDFNKFIAFKYEYEKEINIKIPITVNGYAIKYRRRKAELIIFPTPTPGRDGRRSVQIGNIVIREIGHSARSKIIKIKAPFSFNEKLDKTEFELNPESFNALEDYTKIRNAKKINVFLCVDSIDELKCQQNLEQEYRFTFEWEENSKSPNSNEQKKAKEQAIKPSKSSSNK